MANFCVIKKPSGWSGSDAQWTSASTGAQFDGVYNPAYFRQQATGAAVSTGFYFDADTYGISCSSFPSAGGGPDPMISQAAAINLLNTSVANLQTQVNAIQSGSITSAPNPNHIVAMSALFGATLLAAVLIYGGKAVLAQFRPRLTTSTD